MHISFATCERHRALGFLKAFYPSHEVTDTPECAGDILDLVEKDIVRIPDPTMHPAGGVVPGKNWNENDKSDVVAQFKEFHRRLGI